MFSECLALGQGFFFTTQLGDQTTHISRNSPRFWWSVPCKIQFVKLKYYLLQWYWLWECFQFPRKVQGNTVGTCGFFHKKLKTGIMFKGLRWQWFDSKNEDVLISNLTKLTRFHFHGLSHVHISSSFWLISRRLISQKYFDKIKSKNSWELAKPTGFCHWPTWSSLHNGRSALDLAWVSKQYCRWLTMEVMDLASNWHGSGRGEPSSCDVLTWWVYKIDRTGS